MYTRFEVEAHILAGIVFAVRFSQSQGAHVQFISGALAMAEHSALAAEIDWPDLIGKAKRALGSSTAHLIDQAITYIGAGKPS